MPTACLNRSNLRVHLKGERLEVYGCEDESEREKLLREIPLRDLERLIISDSVHFTTPALAAVLQRGVPMQVFSWSGKFLGGFLPSQNHHGLSRLQQYRRTLDPAFCLQIARRIVVAKLYNQRRVLQRLAASHAEQLPPETVAAPRGSSPEGAAAPPPLDIAQTLVWLDSLFASIRVGRTIDELRGYEGASTARYFQAWGTFLPSQFPFERRSTRPPLNPVNACISFGSTILYHEMVAFLHSHGLDAALGVLHSTENGRWSLALDLIEPFRPILVEALALDLFSHQILKSVHFEDRNGGVYLNEEGRAKFFLQYERRMERQFLSEAVGHRTTIRQQLEQQAVQFKASLEDLERYEPFLMN